jgi:transposase-like protein
VLAENPTTSKAELARKVGITRTSLYYALRHLKSGDAQSTAHAESGKAVAVTHQQLVERVAHAADDVRLVIGDLRAEPTTPTTAAAVFRGYSTAAKLWHLLGELLGEIAPPQQTLYLNQVTLLLEQSVAPTALSRTTRTALGLTDESAAAAQ